jgi:hypothetical protein
MKKSAVLPLSEAVVVLGLTSRYKHPVVWLVRLLRGLEKRTGYTYLHRVNPASKRPTYVVNVDAVRPLVGEDVPQDRFVALLTPTLRGLRDSMGKIDDRLDEINANLAALAEAVRKLAQARRAA